MRQNEYADQDYNCLQDTCEGVCRMIKGIDWARAQSLTAEALAAV